MIDALFLETPREYPTKSPNHRIRQRESEGKSLSFHRTVELKQPHTLTEPISKGCAIGND